MTFNIDPLSDMNLTMPETPTVTPAQTKPASSEKGEKKYTNPKVTPTSTRDRQTPVTVTPSKTSPPFKPFGFVSPSGLWAYKSTPMTQPSALNDTEKSPSPIMED